MADLLIHNARVCRFGHREPASAVLVRDGVIASVDPEEPVDGGTPRLDAGGRRLTPGLIDLHIHGIERWLFESSPEAMVAGVNALAKYGVTTVLPTLYRVFEPEQRDMLRSLIAALADCDAVHVPGVHMEGPFLRLGGAGALTLDGDLALLDDLMEIAGGRLAAMSVSPDTPHILPVIERLHAADVRVFVTHTRADVAQTQAAIDAGARHATHFYDVFPVPPEVEPGARPVGAVEVLLGDPRTTVDFIGDGIHVDPAAIRMALAAKGKHGVSLITDANIGAGLGRGLYDTPWGFRVRVDDGAARVDLPGDPRHGGLAGSVLTMPRGVANLADWLGDETQAWAMASRNPAAAMGWPHTGVITEGASADLVLWDPDPIEGCKAWRTFVAGRCVYQASPTEVSTNV